MGALATIKIPAVVGVIASGRELQSAKRMRSLPDLFELRLDFLTIMRGHQGELLVQPAKRLGRFLWKTGDGAIIDGLGPDGISARVVDITNRVVKLQTGYLYHYAFAMLIGVAALVTWMML